MCFKKFLWNFEHLPIYKGRKLFFRSDFFCLKRPKEAVTRGMYWRNRSLTDNYYFDTSRVGQLDTLDIFATYKGVRGAAELCSKKPCDPHGWRRRHVGGSHPTKMPD